jgi:hypothetical protein
VHHVAGGRRELPDAKPLGRGALEVSGAVNELRSRLAREAEEILEMVLGQDVVVVEIRQPFPARELEGPIHGRAAGDHPALERILGVDASRREVLEPDSRVSEGGDPLRRIVGATVADDDGLPAGIGLGDQRR